MQGYERDNLRRELDEALLPLRLMRKRKGGATAWLKSIRQAVGLPVELLREELQAGGKTRPFTKSKVFSPGK